MFTGLIEEIGTVRRIERGAKGARLTIAADTVLENTKNRLNQAGDELDKLVGVRTRKIQSTLKRVESLPTEGILEDESDV